ncbi:UPF0481 protein At3g47200-like [Neltuma alba]|uniref:UPF0481 protein At3g47200-like n=1 Tax=Neltuma alba TaxID=207710 RepID=UPI0010A59A5B|nr:UPF0481 protein At3g47200-like [Prosopis alba]
MEILDSQNEEKTDLLCSLKAKLQAIDSLELPLSSGCCIYKVPPKIRKVNEEAYTPTLISIGPFHHGDKRLESMEEVKLWCLNNFLKRSKEKLLEDYVQAVRDWEDETRRCYSETIPMKSNDFVSMILTDGCFIIEYFLSCLGLLEQNPWRFKLWPTCDINLDLILLENQLPFFVLKGLFDLTFPTGFNDRFSFTEIAFNFFRRVFLHHIVTKKELRCKFTFKYFQQHYLEQTTTTQFESSTVTKVIHHLNAMLRMFYLPNQLPRREFGKVKPVYGARQLREAGIKFQVNEQQKSITDLKYSKGVLKIPYFQISDWTEMVVRNMVAFEQCHLALESYVTDYVTLLNYLIDTGKDIELLVEKGIMDNLLGSNDEVASLVNSLDKNTVFMTCNSDYQSLCEELNKFYENPYHKYKAVFKHEYLSTPWRIASFIAAILLLILTLIQTICSLPFINK